MDIEQSTSPDHSGGIFEALIDGVTGFIAVLFEQLQRPEVLAAIAGAVIAVFVVEFLKRFAELRLLAWIFDGAQAVLKMRLAAAAIGGMLAVLLLDEASLRVQVVVFIAAAAASPTIYDIAYRIAPSLTDRLLRRVRGEPQPPPPAR